MCCVGIDMTTGPLLCTWLVYTLVGTATVHTLGQSIRLTNPHYIICDIEIGTFVVLCTDRKVEERVCFNNSLTERTGR